MRKSQQHAAEISAASAHLVEDTVTRLYRRHPELKARYGPVGKIRCREDIAYHFCTLIEALLAEDQSIFLKYVEWGKILLTSRKIRADDLLDCLLVMQDVLKAGVSTPTATRANVYIQHAVDHFETFADSQPSFIDSRAPLAEVANGYLSALLSADRSEARRIVNAATLRGVKPQDIYQHVFEPVQREVGRLWLANHITVAQEHYCTGSTEIVMSELRHEIAGKERNGHLFVGACVAGEQHSIGIRMVSEMMEANGWNVYFTGANTPSASLVDLVRRLNVHVLGISCASVLNLLALRELVQSIRDVSSKIRIMVGGRVFNESLGLWKKVGADAYAENAIKAPQVASKLAEKKKSSARTA